MNLEILTPEKAVYKGVVELVQLPGTSGSFEILNNHTPIISSLEKGRIKIIDGNKLDLFCEVAGGVIECKGNTIVVLATEAKMINA